MYVCMCMCVCMYIYVYIYVCVSCHIYFNYIFTYNNILGVFCFVCCYNYLTK